MQQLPDLFEATCWSHTVCAGMNAEVQLSQILHVKIGAPVKRSTNPTLTSCYIMFSEGDFQSSK